MKTGHGEKLSRKREQAVVALLEQPTFEQAAAVVGVNEKTLRSWLKLPQFQAEYRAARRQIVDGAILRLQQLATGAVLALSRNLTCGTPSVEVRAAQAILQHSIRAIEFGEILNGGPSVTNDFKTIESTADIVNLLAKRQLMGLQQINGIANARGSGRPIRATELGMRARVDVTGARDGVNELRSALGPGACNRDGLRHFGALS